MRKECIKRTAGSPYHYKLCVSCAALYTVLPQQEKQKCANISAQSGDNKLKAHVVQFRAVPFKVCIRANYAK